MWSNLFIDHEMLWICLCGYVVTDTQDTIILVFLSQIRHILCFSTFCSPFSRMHHMTGEACGDSFPKFLAVPAPLTIQNVGSR